MCVKSYVYWNMLTSDELKCLTAKPNKEQNYNWYILSYAGGCYKPFYE